LASTLPLGDQPDGSDLWALHGTMERAEAWEQRAWRALHDRMGVLGIVELDDPRCSAQLVEWASAWHQVGEARLALNAAMLRRHAASLALAALPSDGRARH
jgi:hypothetical protein